MVYQTSPKCWLKWLNVLIFVSRITILTNQSCVSVTYFFVYSTLMIYTVYEVGISLWWLFALPTLGTVSCRYTIYFVFIQGLHFEEFVHEREHIEAWGWFNIKMPSSQYQKSHFGDKMMFLSSYLHNGISHCDKKTSSYWIKALVNKQGIATNRWHMELPLILCDI